MADPGGDYDRLYRQHLALLREVDRLSTLREVALTVGGSLELNEALPLIANVVQGALDLRRLTIYTLTDDGGHLRPIVAKYGDDLITADRLEEESEPRRGSPLGQALDTRSVVLEERGDHSAAYVPLRARNESLGVMLLEDRRDGVPFDDEDAVLFQQLAAQISVAIRNAQLYALAVTDGLTGLYVRRYFDLRMQEQIAAAARYQRPFSVMMFDIDHFKKFNDTHGHQTGDAVLRQFAELLRHSTRGSDICCRYGGEEMAIVLPETEMEEAALLANKLCAHIRRNVFRGAEDQDLSVTTSVGVASYTEEFERPEQMVAAADEALYQAKQLGRDRVELADM